MDIINIIKKLIPKDLPKHLGRWKIEKCDVKINNKIDLSNEDHCGPCGQYILLKKNDTEKNIDISKNINISKNIDISKNINISKNIDLEKNKDL